MSVIRPKILIAVCACAVTVAFPYYLSHTGSNEGARSTDQHGWSHKQTNPHINTGRSRPSNVRHSQHHAAPGLVQAAVELEALPSKDAEHAHDCSSCASCRAFKEHTMQQFGGPGHTVTVENLPPSNLRIQVASLEAEKRERVLSILSSMRFTQQDADRMFVTPDGKSIGINCRPLELGNARSKSQNSVDGELFAMVHDCFNPDHEGPDLTYHLRGSYLGREAKLDTNGVELPVDWLGRSTTINGKIVTLGNQSAASATISEFQVNEVIYDHETELAKEEANSSPEEPSNPPVQSSSPQTEVHSLLVIYANTNDFTYPESKKQAVIDTLFNNTRNVDGALRAATYGQYGISLGDAVTVTLNINASQTESDVMRAQMITAVEGMNYDLSNYNRVLFKCPQGTLKNNKSSWTAYANLPGTQSTYSYAWSGVHVDGVAHELGHNYGLGHSGDYNSSSEYGDVSCIMGSSHSDGKSATFSAPKKFEAGWMTDHPTAEIQISGDATYDMYPVAVRPDLTPGMRMVRLPGGFYSSYVRDDDANYATLWDNNDHDKVLVHQSPGVGNISRLHAKLAPDASYSGNGFDVIVERYGPSNEYVTVSYDLDDGNSKPIANDLTVATQENSSKQIQLPGYDLDPSDTLQYSIVVDPSNGQVTGSGSTRTYTPTLNFTGTDSFVYKVSDGKISSFGTVTITVFDTLEMWVSSPNGGEQIAIGTSRNIHWGSSAGGDVKIELYKGESFHSTIASSTPNDGHYLWTVPAVELAADYKIIITRLQSPNQTDDSDSAFSIINALQLTSPLGGETWTQSTSNTITWKSYIGGTVKIELYKGGAIDRTITSATGNSGSYDWVIPTLQSPASDYRIRISSVEIPEVNDASPSNFAIAIATNTLLDENLDTNPGFTMQGEFEYGTPSGNNVPSQAHTGTKIYDTDLDYTAFGSGTLTTPPLNCSNHENIVLRFYENIHTYNTYTVEASINQIDWTILHTVNRNYSPNDNWTLRTINLPAEFNRKETVYIRWAKTGGSEWTGSGVAIDDILITGTFVNDLAVPGISIAESESSTELTEGGAGDSYTVQLDSAPTHDVVITVSPDGTDVTASPSTLTFNSSNWNTPRTVTVDAIDDSDHELLHSGIITHSVASDDSNYASLSVASVIASIQDNDNQAPTANPGSPQTVALVSGNGGSRDPVADPYYEWDAAKDTSGVDTWESTAASTATSAYNWTFAQNPRPTTVMVDDSRFDNLSKAYPFPAARSISQSSFEGNIFENGSGTWEFVLDTDADEGLIMESGGGTDGFQFWITGGTLMGQIRDGGNGGKVTTVSHPLSVTDKSRFIHVVYVIDMTVDDELRLYVDGTEVDQASWTGTDYCGGDNAGLGTTGGSSPTGYNTQFTGKIALIRYYEGSAFSDPEVTTNFNSLSLGNSATVTLGGDVSDPNNDPLTSLWEVENGPGPVTFADPTDPDTTATFTIAGTYTLRLTTTDGVASDSNTVQITIENPSNNNYTSWLAGFDLGGQTGFNEDPDGDLITNGLESYFGTDPSSASGDANLSELTVDPPAKTFTFRHPLNPNMASDIVAVYRWSPDLGTFHDDGATAGPTTVDFTQSTPTNGWVTVTATVTGTMPERLFTQIQVSQQN